MEEDIDESMDVLLGPAEVMLQRGSYSRTYNFLKGLPDEVSATTIVNETEEGLCFPNAEIYTIGSPRRLQYFAEGHLQVWRTVTKHDLYHYPNVNLLDWNPSVLLGATEDVPVVLGPCEAGHAILEDDFLRYLDTLTDVDVPESIAGCGYHAFQSFDTLVKPVRRALFSQTLDAADRIVAVNKATKDIYEQYTETPVDIIPYGVNLDRVEYHEREDTKEILYVGRMIRRKGHDDLLRALSRILDAVPDAHLHLIGDAPRGEEIRDLAARLSVQDAVTVHGYLPEEEFRDYFRRAQVFVHPSLSEGYSHVRLEAMASGCPVVGTDVRGASEMIRDGTDGYVVERESPSSIAERTIELLRNPGLAREMGSNARHRVEERHDWADVARRYTETYRDLLNERR